MTDDLPAPFVPADVDLRDYGYIPLEFRRLFASETWILGNSEERVACIALWSESWHQVPASSLPDDDRVLAHLSQSGARWKRLKNHALRGWVKCSDGRLYHPVVAEKAMEAWESKRNQSRRGRAGAAARWGASATGQGSLLDRSSHSKGMHEAMLTDGNRSEGKGDEGKGISTPLPPNGFHRPDWVPQEAWDGFEEMRRKINKSMTDRARKLIVTELENLRAQGFDPGAVLDQSTRKSWQDVYPIRGDSGGRGGRQAGLEQRNRDAAEEFLRKGEKDEGPGPKGVH